jgi:hypothetical protein
VNGKHLPSYAFFNGTLNGSSVREYIVPIDSPFFNFLKSVPHTTQPLDHIEGKDGRPTFCIKFNREVRLYTLHKLLLTAKINGRVTRWGHILCTELTPEVERLFASSGGETPTMRFNSVRSKRQTATKAVEADRLARQKAERDRRAKEDEALPCLIIVSKPLENGHWADDECQRLQSALLEKWAIHSILRALDHSQADWSVSQADADKLVGAFLSAGDVSYFVDWHPNNFDILLDEAQGLGSRGAVEAVNVDVEDAALSRSDPGSGPV